MKKLLLFLSFILSILFIVSSCGSEEGTDPAKPATFIRYYSGGYGDQAVGFEKTSDNGFIILGNTFPGDRKKIKLIKTDETGAATWTKVYPDFGSGIDYSASGLQILPNDGGYVITGSEIKSQKLLVLKVDANGDLVKTATFGATDFVDASNPSGISASGVSVAVNAAGNFVVLGQKISSIKMILMGVNKDDLSKTWFFSYPPSDAGNPVGGLTKGMYVDKNDAVNWARYVDSKSLLVKSDQQSQLVTHDLPVTNPNVNELPKDFSRYGNAFALVGDNLNSRLFFRKISENGSSLGYRSSLPDSSATTTGTYQSYNANSISSTHDGGLIILSTASVTTGLAETQDLYLIKLDAFGKQEWTSILGSAKFKDAGAAVRQTGDGSQSGSGYAALGTTTQGGLEMIVFIKTGSTGKVE